MDRHSPASEATALARLLSRWVLAGCGDAGILAQYVLSEPDGFDGHAMPAMQPMATALSALLATMAPGPGGMTAMTCCILFLLAGAGLLLVALLRARRPDQNLGSTALQRFSRWRRGPPRLCALPILLCVLRVWQAASRRSAVRLAQTCPALHFEKRHSMNILTTTAMTAVIAAAVLALSACGATSSPASVTGSTLPATSGLTSTPSPLMSSSSAGMTMLAAPSGPHNQADITFAQQMTIHHQGAIAMADLAPTRAASSQVKALAATIKAAQALEITEMAGWLVVWAPSTDMNGMPMTTAATSGTRGMAGTMTDQQMGALTAASGAAFDKLFLQLMIDHHQGALEMAKTEKLQGSNPAALTLAQDITTSQTAQIDQMHAMLKGL